MARMPHLYPRAVQLLPTIGETHWMKAALAINRFADRYPHWDDRLLSQAVEHAGWSSAPYVQTLFHLGVVGQGIKISRRRAQGLIARGLFPLAYLAGREWYDQEGLRPVILSLKERAIHEGTYLGHGWTVWCSFLEVEPELVDEQARLFCLERFVEFAAKDFPGYPASDPNWQPVRRSDPGEVDHSAVMDACLERPGFFGHHLLTLGYLHRHRAILSDVEWRIGLATVGNMAATTYLDPEDNVCIPAAGVPAASVTADDLERAILDLILKGPADPHSLTLTDIAYDLWQIANDRQQRHLLHYLRTFVA